LTEKEINKRILATKFPVFKNVQAMWSYDYKAEERKRFKGELMWDPSSLDHMFVDEYLLAV